MQDVYVYMYVYMYTYMPDAAVSRIAAERRAGTLSKLNPSNFVETHMILRVVAGAHEWQGQSIL